MTAAQSTDLYMEFVVQFSREDWAVLRGAIEAAGMGCTEFLHTAAMRAANNPAHIVTDDWRARVTTKETSEYENHRQPAPSA